MKNFIIHGEPHHIDAMLIDLAKLEYHIPSRFITRTGKIGMKYAILLTGTNDITVSEISNNFIHSHLGTIDIHCNIYYISFSLPTYYNHALDYANKFIKDKNLKLGTWVYYNGTKGTFMGKVTKVLPNVTTVEELYTFKESTTVTAAHEKFTEASTDNVLNHLKEEAINRGYKVNKTVINLHDSTTKHKISSDLFNYFPQYDSLQMGDVNIYNKGKWANLYEYVSKRFTFGNSFIDVDKEYCIYDTKIKIRNIEVIRALKQLRGIKVDSYDLKLRSDSNIKIGCANGTFKELVDIVNHIFEIDREGKTSYPIPILKGNSAGE